MLTFAAVSMSNSGAAARTVAKAGRHYSALAGSGLGQSYFSLDVSPDGHHFAVRDEQFGFTCTGGTDRGQTLGISTADGQGTLGADGSFAVALTVVSDSPGQVVHDTPVQVSGRFTSGRRAVGGLSFRGSDGEDLGCNASQSWSAKLVPLNLRYAGRTSTGARVTFERSIAAHPEILNFSVGATRARCASGVTELKTIQGAYGGHVHHGRFHAQGEDSSSEAAAVAGHFSDSHHASGSVGISGRDDCGYGGLHWSARLVSPRAVTGRDH